MKKVGIILTPSKNEVLRKAARLVGEGISELGIEVNIYDSLNMTVDELLGAVQESDLILSLQAAFLNTLLSSGTPFVELLDCKYCGWIFDSPWYHFDKVSNARYSNVYLKTIDEGHKESILAAVKCAKNIDTLFHGGFVVKEFKKEYDIIFSGNMFEEPRLEDFVQNMTEVDSFMLENGIKILEANPDKSVEDVIRYIFSEINEELTTEVFRQLIPVMMYLESLLRVNYRKEILERLVNTGLKITLIGTGYAEEILAKDNVDYLGELDIDQTVEAIGKSKILVDTSVMYPYGFHERIFTALLGKAICFTTFSEYRKTYMGDRLKYYNVNELDRLIDEVSSVLDNWDGLAEYVEDNYQYALGNHTWERRGKQIIESIMEI